MVTKNGRRRREYAPRVPIEQRRRELLDAALRIVVRDGHGAVTMEAVAAATGVTKPVVYGVFPNRETLLGELLRREQAAALEQLVELLPALRKGLAAGAHPADVLAEALDGFLAAVRAAPERWSCVVSPMADMPAQFNAAREETRGLVLASAEELGRWITRTFDASTDLDPELIAHTVVTLAEMAARLVLTDPERYEPARFVKGLRAAVGLVR
ncbi:TetR/AcrR family transcriptional regulator [Catenulispora sp. NL8]|uniref:TetR/AcrR family transcriptional regulator n=1 Tax=Catenulispora pinistramenti TaxID=2705254 RepID=A0ABS5L1L0_9ACTN|nr:TetR/AcrR family transcriptional regulator [Catenulispora pinistramenti]MBS2552145.1 TetR/AcrR family transcriptional regulator [Catenulispora pinistramenti]